MNRENYVTSLLLKSGNFVILLPYLLLIYFIPPLIFGLFFAYLVYPIFNFFKRTLKLPFSIVVIIFSLLLFSTIVAFIFLFIQSLLHLLPTLQTALLSFSKTYSNHPLLPYFVEKLSTLINDLTLFFIDFIKNMINSIFELFIFIITFYFSLFESRKNRLWFFSYTPKKYRAQWSRYFEKSMNLIGFFVVVEMQLFTLTFALLSIGFYFLQFDGFIAKAFLIAIADVLPFFGIGIFLIPLAIFYYFTNQPLLAAAIFILYIFVQITRQLTESMLWSHTLHLRMIHTFIISAASVLLFGFYGILISPILLMVAIRVKQSTIFAK